MKNNDLLDAIGDVDDELIEQAKPKRRSHRRVWSTLGAIAACLVLVATIPMVLNFLNVFDNEPDPPDNGMVENGVLSIDDLNRPYKDNMNIAGNEYGIVWKWDDLTVSEQYSSLEIDGAKYRNRGRVIGAELIGKKIGKKTLTGYATHPQDNPKGPRYKMFEVYEIRNISTDRLVAVLMEGKYYVFLEDRYNPPATWGEVMEEYGLAHVLELNHFSQIVQGKETAGYGLADDDYVWEVLSSCLDAPSVDSENWKSVVRSYICFTVTSEALGTRNVAMYVTEDGYLWTNAFGYAYLYYIGEEATGKIISYALSHTTEVKSESYEKSVVGTVVAITDEYLLLSDAVLCEKPADGITFRILLNDLRIRRYVTNDVIREGGLARIVYNGVIDVENDYTISGAVSASEVILTDDGDVLIPE